MKRFKDKQGKIKQIKTRNIKPLLKKIGALIAAGALTIAIPATVEATENSKLNEIKQNSQIEVAHRSFKNIDQNNIGPYLKEEIERLYYKYPDLDDLIYDKDEQTKDLAFVNDIYRLYKAYLVDRYEKEVNSIGDVKVTTTDQIISSSDRLTEGENKLLTTHKEQYKAITDEYVQTKEERKDASKLSNMLYELLARELGLKEGVLTSEQIAQEIEEYGFYYNKEENTFYTAKGKAHLEYDKQTEQEQTKNMQAKVDEERE